MSLLSRALSCGMSRVWVFEGCPLKCHPHLISFTLTFDALLKNLASTPLLRQRVSFETEPPQLHPRRRNSSNKIELRIPKAQSKIFLL
jgi:hypothetical protein